MPARAFRNPVPPPDHTDTATDVIDRDRLQAEVEQCRKILNEHQGRMTAILAGGLTAKRLEALAAHGDLATNKGAAILELVGEVQRVHDLAMGRPLAGPVMGDSRRVLTEVPLYRGVPKAGSDPAPLPIQAAGAVAIDGVPIVEPFDDCSDGAPAGRPVHSVPKAT